MPALARKITSERVRTADATARQTKSATLLGGFLSLAAESILCSHRGCVTPAEFIVKWSAADLSERASYQQHFLDLCELVGHPKPAELDATGELFAFEKGTARQGGGNGWADVWKRGFFAFEYKGPHANLAQAYEQLLQYREALDNPPLLVTCDTRDLEIHTNFTGAPAKVHRVALGEISSVRGFEVLRCLFFEPDKLRPGATNRAITEEAASRLGHIAESLRQRGIDPHTVAQFLDRMVFCLFAEDIGLLPPKLFSQMVIRHRYKPTVLKQMMGTLFQCMAHGGQFGIDEIRHFNGDLFTDAPALELTADEINAIYEAAQLEWNAVDASIFGTLFERGLDPAKRAQLGAHYTSREDIETLVEPIVLAPLRREWVEVRAVILNLLATGRKQPTKADTADLLAKGETLVQKGELLVRKSEQQRATGEKFIAEGRQLIAMAQFGAGCVEEPATPYLGTLAPAQRSKAIAEADMLKARFLDRLARVTVLDPACGSGNFLFVTLQKLKILEKEVITYGSEAGLKVSYIPRIVPWQLRGLELSPYAHDLAQMVVWIGYLQWSHDNGFAITDSPLLRKLSGFQCRDSILDLTDPATPRVATWPAAEFVVGNPPFLGGKLLRRELGDAYVDALFKTWAGRVPAEADLCCYWFEQAREQIAAGHTRRAGLLATQGIRGGANREVIKRIKESGDIFFAIGDREWILDGAAVHISMVGFDDGSEKERTLNGCPVPAIHPNLSASAADTTQAVVLPENRGLSFMGDTKVGPFDIPESLARKMLPARNPHGKPNSDVVRPWANGLDVTRVPQGKWIIDFPPGMDEREAMLYEQPYEYLRRYVQPMRATARSGDRTGVRWWIHQRPRPEMRIALAKRDRFIATTTVSKHRVFVWLPPETLPDHQLIVFARDDDWFFGVLHSRFHQIWALCLGTQLREKESGFRYTPTTCFETFPFPWTPGTPLGKLTRAQDDQRTAIAQAARALDALRADWLGDRTDPKRTLTALYNDRPEWLQQAHASLDEAVAAAYGWPGDLPDDEIVTRLLALNRDRTVSREISQIP